MKERKKGYWTENDYCSVCKNDIPWFIIGFELKPYKTKYCPNCGSRLLRRKPKDGDGK